MVSVRRRARNWRIYLACGVLGLVLSVGVASALQWSVLIGGNAQKNPLDSVTDAEHQGKNNNANQKYSEDWWGLLFNGVTGISTFLLVVVGSAQLYMFYRQLALMRSSVRDTRIAADAAKESADIMKITAERQLRAYLALVTHNPMGRNTAGVGIDKNASKITATVHLKNTGQTPAYKVSSNAFITLCDMNSNGVDLYQANSIIDEHNGVINSINPGEAITIHRTIGYGFGYEMWNEMVLGRAAIYFFGKIEFIDAFDIPRHIFFQFYFTGPPIEKNCGFYTNNIFETCKKGNDSN